jgi:hypothetical protein
VLVSEFLEYTNDALRGTDEDAPTIGTDEANLWLRTLNRKKNELYRNAKVLWDETWAIQSLGAITASATPSYNTDVDLIAPSDHVYAVDTNSNKIYYDLVKPRERPKTGRQFYLAGMNPQVLYCSNEIEATEDIVGGTLHLPGYYMPADINTATETGTTVIPFADPYYAVMAVASEIAFNDITFEDKSADLAGKAQFLYMQMIRNNRRNTYGNARPVARSVNRIRGTEVN